MNGYRLVRPSHNQQRRFSYIRRNIFYDENRKSYQEQHRRLDKSRREYSLLQGEK